MIPYGWIDGFALPVRRSGSHIALVSLVCTQPLDPAADKRFLTHASYCYLERILERHHQPGLSGVADGTGAART